MIFASIPQEYDTIYLSSNPTDIPHLIKEAHSLFNHYLSAKYSLLANALIKVANSQYKTEPTQDTTTLVSFGDTMPSYQHNIIKHAFFCNSLIRQQSNANYQRLHKLYNQISNYHPISK